ncbi:DUF2190 family protein [Jeongeupia wiesaeckerbachi]|uniref:capsid cement protein n=1 Tax=Jeongeupia wiesaeckerbachi TaxID=3051218 RepID=UPI003D800FF1
MKPQHVTLTTSVLALTDLTQRRFVGFDGGICAAGTKALGVVEVDTGAGNMAPSNVLGVILVEAGAAIAAGAEVQSDAAGKAITKAAGVGNGFAWDAAAAAGDVIRIVRGI